MHVSALLEMAISLDIDNAARLRKQELMFAILKKRAKAGEQIFGDGALEVLPDGFGFLRSPDASYMASTDDLHQPIADPPFQPAHRRLDRRRSAHPQGWRALLRPGEGGQSQRRIAGIVQAPHPV
jgi:hypothetical protein